MALFDNLDIGGLLGGIGSIVGGYENAQSMQDMQDMLRKAMEDAAKNRQEQLGLARNLYDERVGGDVATQKDLQQFDTGFAIPGVQRFEPAYDVAYGRYAAGDQYSPESLRGLLQQRAQDAIDNAYGDVTNATAMQALRTGTNAADTLSELAKERAKSTREAFTEAELQALTGSQQMNLANREAGRKDLDTAQSPLAGALAQRTGGAGTLLAGSQKGRDVATTGLFGNLASAYGDTNKANMYLAPALANSMQGSDPWATMIGGVGKGLEGILGSTKKQGGGAAP